MAGAVNSSRRNAHGLVADSHDSLQVHVLGALGELAVCRYLGYVGELTVDTYKTAADVGQYEVRTRSRPNYELIVRDDDPNDAVFILVLKDGPVFRIKGWIRGRDAKRAEWVQRYGGRPPAYFVPHASMRVMGTLPQLEASWRH